MPQPIEIPFGKFNATGNDFIVVSARPGRQTALQPLCLHLSGANRAAPADVSILARAVCRRRTGVGADGLLVILPPHDKNNLARMLVLNADGSEAEMSGNGIRCAAAYLLDGARRPLRSRRGGKAAEGTARRELRIETVAGVKPIRVAKAEDGRWVFRVEMGEPILAPEKISFRGADATPPAVSRPLTVSSRTVHVTVTSMGNPHCSIFVDDFEALDWLQMGRELERHESFLKRTNVEFVRVLSSREIEVRFWERGVGQTQSSGTGSCAAVVASILNQRTGRKVRVRTLAGDLEVAWPRRGGVTLTGPVERVARGTYTWREGQG